MLRAHLSAQSYSYGPLTGAPGTTRNGESADKQ